MNSNVMKMLPVMVLALGLSACGSSKSSSAPKSQQPTITQAELIDTTFQADCGGQPSAAVAAAYDVTSCQLTSAQKALLQKVGPFSVEADCVQRSVRVRNAAGEIAGQDAFKEDGTYSVALAPTTDAFSLLEGCPVNLEGTATGTVTCKDDKVENVKVNTVFSFAAIPTEGAPAAGVTDATTPAADSTVSADAPGAPPIPLPTMTPPPPKGGKTPWPAPGITGQGKHPHPVPPPTAAPGVASEDALSPAPHPSPWPTPAPKGGKVSTWPTKGGQGGPHPRDPEIAPSRVDSCVSFNPCMFNSSAELSCGAGSTQ